MLFQFAAGEVPEEIKELLCHNQEIFGDDYHLETRKRPEGMSDKEFKIWAAIESDIYRFEIGSMYPDAIVACWDLLLLEDPRPTFTESGAPYFAAWKGRSWNFDGQQRDPQADSVLTYCNGCCDFFKERLASVKHDGYGAQMATLRDIPFYSVDPTLFYHKKNGLYGYRHSDEVMDSINHLLPQEGKDA